MRLRPRQAVVSVLTGMFLVGTAIAGTVLAPVGETSTTVSDATGTKVTTIASAEVGEGVELGPDEALVGAAKINIYPQPDATKGEKWEQDITKCNKLSQGDVEATLTHVPDFKLKWAENTNCIYAGGFGLGPSQPLSDFDPVHGLWVRSAAYSRGGRTVVVTLLDGEGYFGEYNSMCPPEKACGFFDIQKQLGTELGLDPASFLFASTHAHSAPDFIGGWGGVPTWYMRQVAEALRESVRQAVANAVPGTIETGDSLARQYNSERRDHYHSAEDATLNWVRGIDRTGNVVSTIGTYAAHPTSFGGSEKIAHADWPVQFAKAVEDEFGGVGIAFQAGLGNMSASHNGRGSMGAKHAELLPAVGQGTLVKAPRVDVRQAFWDQPATNLPLTTLGGAGFFDRKFAGPAVVEAQTKGSVRPCRSASATSVRVSVIAAKVGQVAITSAPGEIFANYSNVLEERHGSGGPSINALAIGQAMDALGYMPQSFETDHVGRQAVGFVGGPAEYEDAYSIDACFGDKALVETLKLLAAIDEYRRVNP